MNLHYVRDAFTATNGKRMETCDHCRGRGFRTRAQRRIACASCAGVGLVAEGWQDRRQDRRAKARNFQFRVPQ